jgi:hypothetical protein
VISAVRNIIFLRDADHALMQLLYQFRAELPGDARDGLVIGHGSAAHAGELAVNQIGADFADHRLIAPIAHVFEQQQPQDDFGSGGWPATGLAFLAVFGELLLDEVDQLGSLSSSSAWRIQGSQRSATSAATKPSPKQRWRRRCSIMASAPQLGTFRAQALLIDLANAFEGASHAGEVVDLAADMGDLFGMETDLGSLGTGIDDGEDALEMTLAAGAGSAGDRGGMKGVTFEQGAAEQILERG